MGISRAKPRPRRSSHRYAHRVPHPNVAFFATLGWEPSPLAHSHSGCPILARFLRKGGRQSDRTVGFAFYAARAPRLALFDTWDAVPPAQLREVGTFGPAVAFSENILRGAEHEDEVGRTVRKRWWSAGAVKRQRRLMSTVFMRRHSKCFSPAATSSTVGW